jgi:hypothetical protein
MSKIQHKVTSEKIHKSNLVNLQVIGPHLPEGVTRRCCCHPLCRIGCVEGCTVNHNNGWALHVVLPKPNGSLANRITFGGRRGASKEALSVNAITATDQFAVDVNLTGAGLGDGVFIVGDARDITLLVESVVR